MRNIIKFFAAALIFTACNSKTDTDLETKKDVIVTDTSTMYNSNATTDVAPVEEVKVAPPKPAPTRTVTKTVYVDRPVAPKRRTVRQAAPSEDQTMDPNPIPNNNGTGNNNNGNTNNNTGTTNTPATVPAEKKGWNDATKGAVIGGVGGAIGGAN